MKLCQSLAVILTLISIIAATSCKPTGTPPAGQQTGGSSSAAGQAGDVTLHTSDGFTLVGTFKKAQGSGPFPACLLVHQLGKDRSTYATMQDQLAQNGISSLAIDLRGHGGSTDGGKIDYRGFSTDEQWVAMTADIEAGLAFLRSESSVDKSRIGIVGASIGANLAVVAAGNDIARGTEPPVACLVLLSPSLNYHGVQPVAGSNPARLLGHTPVMIVSGTKDGQSYSGSQTLSQAARGAELVSINGSAHGTDLLQADPTLLGKIVDWIKANINPNSREASPVSAVPGEGSVGGMGKPGWPVGPGGSGN